MRRIPALSCRVLTPERRSYVYDSITIFLCRLRRLYPPALGGLVAGLTGTARAVWPVWRDSTSKEVKFQPLPKKKAVRLYHEARRFERQTRAAAPKGHQDGALGRNGLAVLHALIFDFLNFVSGALFPSIASIAHAANISPRSVSRGLAKLKESGVVNWLRRCAEDWQDGRFICGRKRTPTASCPPRNGAAMCRSRRPRRRRPAHGAIIRPCPTRLPLPAKRRRRACPRWCGSWKPTSATGWRCPWRGLAERSASRAKPRVLSGCQPVYVTSLEDSLLCPNPFRHHHREEKRSRVRTRPVFVRHMRPLRGAGAPTRI